MLAVLTGGHGSLGTALRQVLAEQHWTIAAPTRQELDVTSLGSVTQWFQQLTEPISLLINAAGIVQDGPFLTMPEASWDAVCETNLHAAFRTSQAAARQMQLHRNPGHIIQISSTSALLGTPGQANYAAAKAGLIGLTKSLAKEWGELGIRVNCVLPGWLEPSRLTAQANPKARQAALAQHTLKKFNTPEDAARFIVFLDSMTAVSGQVFQLDSR